MADPDAHPTSTLPLWIAGLCCLAAAALVFGNTLPALEERRELDHAEAELDTLRRRHDNAIETARLAGARGDATAALDLQSLFVAIDQKGYTVAEFYEAHASEADDGDEPATDGRQSAGGR